MRARKSTPRYGVLAVVFSIGMLGFSIARAEEQTATRDVAVVVHTEVPKTELTFTEVRRIFLGEVQYWDQKGLRVTLLIRAPEARERTVLLERVYEMSENQFRQYWIGKLFRGDMPIGPKVVSSGEMTAQLAAAIPGSITFMDAAAVPQGLKVLKIDGHLPGESGYPIQ